MPKRGKGQDDRAARLRAMDEDERNKFFFEEEREKQMIGQGPAQYKAEQEQMAAFDLARRREVEEQLTKWAERDAQMIAQARTRYEEEQEQIARYVATAKERDAQMIAHHLARRKEEQELLDKEAAEWKQRWGRGTKPGPSEG